MNDAIQADRPRRDQSGMDRIIEKTWWQKHRKHLAWAGVALFNGEVLTENLKRL
jgi:hypothetical protein